MGSVSGGCIEDDLIARAPAARPELLHYGVTAEEARRFGLPCGGTLQLVREPLSDATWLTELLGCIGEQRLTARTLDLDSGRVVLSAAHRGDGLRFDGRILTTVHGPRWRLLIIGAGQIARYLAPMAQALDYEVLICDPRAEYAAGWDVPHARLLAGMPDDVVLESQLDAHSAVVALSHDPRLDDMALLEALKSPAFYVGALGSRASNAKRRERLSLFDLTAEQIARLHGPVGLYIGSRTPPEIAVSILAELTAAKNGVGLKQRGEAPAAV